MSKTSKSIRQNITEETARQILGAYGGIPASWPEGQRDELLRMIIKSELLQSTQRDELALDRVLIDQRNSELAQISAQRTESLADRILAGLPPQERTNGDGPRSNRERKTRPRLPELRHWWPLIPALTAGLVIVVTGLLTMASGPGAKVAELEFERWAWEDVTAQALVPESDTDVLEDNELDEFLDLQQDG